MDINSILDSLTDEDIEKLKKTAEQFIGGGDSASENENSNKKNGGFGGFDAIDPNIISTVSKITGAMNKSDPKTDFISSLKPLLKPERSKKIDDAVMMLKFMRVFETLKGNGNGI